MKYKTAKVISHPRAGSHYLAHLLNINFFHLPDYLPLYAGHSDGHKSHLKVPGTAVFYIYRKCEDSMLSMYNMRDRFGLVANSYEDFTQKTLKSMHSTNIKAETILNISGHKNIITKVDTYLSSFNMTPKEYLKDHKEKWLSIEAINYYCIDYDDLINNFEDTMLNISKFLGSDETQFIQERQRIGWYDKNEHKENFS